MFKKIDEVIHFFTKLDKPLLILDGLRVVAINSLAAELFSLDKQILIGQTVLDLSPQLQEGDVSSESLLIQYIDEVNRNEKHNYKWIHNDAHGNAILCTVNLICFQIGNEQFMLEIMEDIKVFPVSNVPHKKICFNSNNLKIRTMLKLKNHEDLSLFKSSETPLCVCTFDGYFKELNDAWTEQLGWSIEALRSKPFLDFVHPEDHNKTLKYFKVLLKGYDLYLFTNRYINQDNQYINLRWSAFSDKVSREIFAIAEIIK